ncbi:VOC family protein [Priestia flexa]|uniref:VOC family protein n=1 Tax=Priestia TaxID=2800373 RepID=UPI0022009A79|nr:VOC family protein [Bacillus sp. 1780r2a1]
MDIYFDHLVHFSPDPHQAQRDMKAHGIQVIEGGQHESWGTYNTLAYFQLSYIEWLSFHSLNTPPGATNTPLIHRLHQEQTSTGQFGHLAFRTSNLHMLQQQLYEKGFHMDTIIDASRKTKNGELLKWKMGFLKDPNPSSLPLPFFIEWEQSDQERIKSLQSAFAHPLGYLHMDAIYCAVHDVKATARKWAHLLDANMGESYNDPSLQATCLKLYTNDVTFIFSQANQGIVNDTLYKVGERPFIVKCTNSNVETNCKVQGGTFWFRK